MTNWSEKNVILMYEYIKYYIMALVIIVCNNIFKY